MDELSVWTHVPRLGPEDGVPARAEHQQPKEATSPQNLASPQLQGCCPENILEPPGRVLQYFLMKQLLRPCQGQLAGRRHGGGECQGATLLNTRCVRSAKLLPASSLMADPHVGRKNYQATLLSRALTLFSLQ